LVVFFFFSSSCRDTSFSRDWSSDVCSSDLSGYTQAQLDGAGFLRGELKKLGADVDGPVLARAGLGALQLALFEETAEAQLWNPRSEERRVRSRRSLV